MSRVQMYVMLAALNGFAIGIGTVGWLQSGGALFLVSGALCLVSLVGCVLNSVVTNND